MNIIRLIFASLVKQIKLQKENEAYLRSHPELKQFLQYVTSQVLVHKPTDVLHFMSNLFREGEKADIHAPIMKRESVRKESVDLVQFVHVRNGISPSVPNLNELMFVDEEPLPEEEAPPAETANEQKTTATSESQQAPNASDESSESQNKTPEEGSAQEGSGEGQQDEEQDGQISPDEEAAEQVTGSQDLLTEDQPVNEDEEQVAQDDEQIQDEEDDEANEYRNRDQDEEDDEANEYGHAEETEENEENQDA